MKASTSHFTSADEFSTEQFRTYALFRFLLGKAAPEIHQDLVAIGGSSAPSERSVRRWLESFRDGRRSVEDLPRAGRPISAITPEYIRIVEEAVVEDPHVSIEELAQLSGISEGTVHTILHERLGRRKICSRWVPHLLNTAQQAERVELAQSLLNKMRRWGSVGMKCVVTGDETYIHYYQPRSRLESMAWTRHGEPPQTEVRQSTFTRKVLYTFFFNMDGLVAKFLSPEGSTITAKYYAEIVLPGLLASFHRSYPNSILRLHHDNAPAHRSKLVAAFIADNNIQCVRHPPYSPDLAPCDFWLFSLLKSKLRGKSFSSRNSIERAVEQAIASIQKDEWSKTFQEWKKRCRMCVETGGTYFEHLM